MYRMSYSEIVCKETRRRVLGDLNYEKWHASLIKSDGTRRVLSMESVVPSICRQYVDSDIRCACRNDGKMI